MKLVVLTDKNIRDVIEEIKKAQPERVNPLHWVFPTELRMGLNRRRYRGRGRPRNRDYYQPTMSVLKKLAKKNKFLATP